MGAGLYDGQQSAQCIDLSIARTPEREAQFHWVGKLLTVQYAMYALQTRQDIRARTVEDLHN